MDENFAEIINGNRITRLHSSCNNKSKKDFCKMIDSLRSLRGVSQAETIEKIGFKKLKLLFSFGYLLEYGYKKKQYKGEKKYEKRRN